ncbi:hypothetical protein [Bradyrhizobium sp. DOA9]|uniref:hypothetical protein n=1 Tax=Bradyrhizobium sp. DOA9 TaxID=1126627 RepID=UPI00178CDA6C|nr:hypothetical protein [Bradyrhizobium sp. DOA9]
MVLASFVLGYADLKNSSSPALRHCERSEAIQNLSAEAVWIASSQGLLAMTVEAVERTSRGWS